MKKFNLKLHHLITSVAVLAFILTIASSLWSSYRTNTQSLQENTLETNRVYAEKLAMTANDYIEETLQTLSISSEEVATFIDDEGKLLHEADRMKNQTNTFNSVLIVDAKGKVLATSPQSLDLKGKKLTSEAMKEAILQKKPMISKPYEGITNRLLIFISVPVFAKDGSYLGLVGGTIYLKEKNILNEVLGEHFYKDGSYVYVIDGDGRIIYHQDKSCINDLAPENMVVHEIITKLSSGASRLTNSEGDDMLAGYSYISIADWGVVAQRPTRMALMPAKNMVKQMLYVSLPLLIISLAIILWASLKIARPLQQLAALTESSMKTNEEKNLAQVPGWYYEVIQLKKALIQSLSFLHGQVSFFMDQSTTDPLTGLTNRRTLDERMQKWTQEKTPYAVILLDIDRFKLVNDSYGHGVGDEVLKFLALKMKNNTRVNDICCRYGGEEFIILLPDTSAVEAYNIAEKLRSDIEKTISPTGKNITISAGIAEYPLMATKQTSIIEKADQYLYEAKEQGRNRVVMTDETPVF
ncbi:GGDEF domain-containing protein [Viridibacillus sp. YIM B01967]|uniref:GGDEF domain-containing protein n=1 Tax=Viridibacillus soli TaxID=2798301 RepID=A0ABS1H8X3_9BACL|nr:sensor domain-containing diguanylate cyclase [Viridibacillus soli]MBK3495850.1 GGDEF domain-containing protein [Viridibacillus soli]